MRIADIVSLKSPSKSKAPGAGGRAEVLTKDMDAVEHVGRLLSTSWNPNYRDRDPLVRKREDLLGDLAKLKVELLCETGTLPENLRSHSAILAQLADTPSTTTDDVRALADMLGFIVLPVEYLSDAALSGEMLGSSNSRELRQSIDNFKGLEDWFEVYVLTPARFYDVQKHVEAADDKPIYAPEILAQTFMALNMSIPMFRALFQESRDNRDRTKRLEAGVANLVQRVTALEAAVEKAQRAALAAEAENAVLRREIANIQTRVVPYDPMLLAVGKGAGILGTTRAFIGPCWGPDFPPVLEKILKDKVVQGQAKLLASASAKWTRRW